MFEDFGPHSPSTVVDLKPQHLLRWDLGRITREVLVKWTGTKSDNKPNKPKTSLARKAEYPCRWTPGSDTLRTGTHRC